MADAGILVGKPIIRGTRLSVEFILGLIGQGWPEEKITQNYLLTADRCAHAFCLRKNG